MTDKLREGIKALGPLGKTLLPELVKLERELDLRERRIIALNTVNHLTSLVARIESQEDVDGVLASILSAALTLSRASRGLIVLRDDRVEDGFTIHATRKMEASDQDSKLSRSLIRQILMRGEGVITTNVQQDERFDPGASLLASNIRSVMATPIKLNEAVIGGIYVDSELTDNIFNDEDLSIISAFADHAAVALTLATSIRAQRELHVQSVLALVNAVEAADAYTAGHSSRVGYYARGIGGMMGFPKDKLELLTFAGYLHDVGKIALKIPVGKDGPLNDAEWEEMKKHPVYGERILRDSPALEAILPAVRSHHEQWAGGGYPDGIRGEAIHPYARIIAVADTFDAMTTDRPYRRAYATEYALAEILRGIGSQFERDTAEAFLQAFADGNLYLADKNRDELDIYSSMFHP